MGYSLHCGKKEKGRKEEKERGRTEGRKNKEAGLSAAILSCHSTTIFPSSTSASPTAQRVIHAIPSDGVPKDAPQYHQHHLSPQHCTPHHDRATSALPEDTEHSTA